MSSAESRVLGVGVAVGVVNGIPELDVRGPGGHGGPLRAQQLVWLLDGLWMDGQPLPRRAWWWLSKNCCFFLPCSSCFRARRGRAFEPGKPGL